MRGLTGRFWFAVSSQPAPDPPVPDEPRVTLARELRQRYPEIRHSLDLADWILLREARQRRILVTALRLYGHHLMACTAWGPGAAGRPCSCGLGDLLKGAD